MLKRPYCHYFNTTGKCHFGKRCRFLHESPNTNSEPDPTYQDEAVNRETVTTVNRGGLPSYLFPEEDQENESLNQDADLTKSCTTSERRFNTRNSTRRNGNLNTDQGKPSAANPVSTDKPICKNYAKDRFCRFGNRCRFQHIIAGKASDSQRDDLKKPKHDEGDENKVQDEGESAPDEIKEAEATSRSVNKEEKRRQSKRICHFYKQGYCRFGRNCSFLHPGWKKPEPEKGDERENTPMEVDSPAPSTENKPDIEDKPAALRAPQITHCYKREDVTAENLAEMRATEIKQLKRRFTTDRLKSLEETEQNAKFVFNFSPTDPDWPFEVKNFDIAVEFMEDYPLKIFNLSLPEEQDIPETVRRYIEKSLDQWLKMKEQQAEAKGTVELLFRPFLRWLDRNIEELVTQALKQLQRELSAKAAGLEFVSAKELKERFQTSSEDESDDGAPVEETHIEPGVIVYKKSDKIVEEVYEVPRRQQNISENADSDDDNVDSDSNEEVDETEHKRPQINPDTERRGTELSFRNMQIWFCTTVMMEKLQLTVQCERCKHTTDFCTPPNRVNSIACGKCHSGQLVVFRPTLAHSYCSTFGYLDLDGCIVFDINLQECHFSMGCIKCNRDVLVKRCTPGKMLEPFCRLCHNKMQFATESVKMTRLTTDVNQSYFSGKVHQVQSKMLRRAVKDPAIQEGKALPNSGSCKHYKKSYRWLRFPCCGKCYPCDTCHEDNEDHEMKYANRMICGFCCREQPYAAEKPCLGCSSALTKVRSTHWEGGRGCRDKIAMSRNDDQKYANMHKTVSKKSQAKKDKLKGKKNTKLRHA